MTSSARKDRWLDCQPERRGGLTPAIRAALRHDTLASSDSAEDAVATLSGARGTATHSIMAARRSCLAPRVALKSTSTVLAAMARHCPALGEAPSEPLRPAFRARTAS
jgi:hypothetical protein